MCGIAGWFCARLAADPAALPVLRGMGERLAHRGPDGGGEWLADAAGLAHRRLAVIDVQGGRQPMTCLDAPITISFNGEIYNYRHLRTELLAAGARFATHSDTEVVLQLYRLHGLAGLRRLRGMYAFALWDGRDGSGVLVRDPLGIKPLFMRPLASGGLAFASEAKALFIAGLESGDARPELDPASLHLLLNLRYLPGSHSLLRDVEQLPPGSALRWRQTTGARQECFAAAAPATGAAGHRAGEPLPGEAADSLTPEALLAGIDDALQAHLTADVEVGSYLSGGLDTATLVALARRAGTRLRTFTIDAGDDPREARFAAESARLLDVPNRQASADGALAGALAGLVWHLEVPKVNALQVQQAARLARDDLKVVLSGLGADELLLGYNLHRWLHQASRLPRAPARLAGATAAPLLGALYRRPPWREAERAARALAALGDWPRVYGLLRNVWDCPRLRRCVYGPRMLDAALPDAFELLAARWPTGADPVQAAARFEWREKMVNDLLWQEDRCSMAVGLEVRVPFVDTRLAALVQPLDRAALMPGGRPKGLFRQALAELLPAAVLARPKSGFQVAAGPFFEAHLGTLADRVLAEPRVRAEGLFNPDFVRQVRRAGPRKALRWHYFMLYLMLMTGLWLEAFEGAAALGPAR